MGGIRRTTALLLVAGAVAVGGWLALRVRAPLAGVDYPAAVVQANALLFRGLEAHEAGDRNAATRHWQQAAALFERALDLEPDDLQSRADLGLLYFYLGDVPRALVAEQQVLTRDPNYLLALFNLGWMHQTLAQPEPAAAYMRRYLAVVDTERAEPGKYRDQTLLDRQVAVARRLVAEAGPAAEAGP